MQVPEQIQSGLSVTIVKLSLGKHAQQCRLSGIGVTEDRNSQVQNLKLFDMNDWSQ